MADRYQNRPFPRDDYDRNDQFEVGPGESDPLAELARLIGQTDPFGSGARTNQTAPRPTAREPYQAPAAEPDDVAPAGPPPWMQRANARTVQSEQPSPDYRGEGDFRQSAVHPLHRYAAQHHEAEQNYQQDPADYDEADPSRYDDALYGQIESGAQDYQRQPAYPDDPYAYQEGYEEDPDEEPQKRRGGLVTVVAILALAVLGTGGAFAYRSYFSAPRSGEPPIIKADNSPTKIIPANADSSAKVTDRMAVSDGTEKIVSREETPVDINANAAGPRVVFPPLNPNSNPPAVASVSTSTMPATLAPGTAPTSGTLASGQPRKIKTFGVHDDQPDSDAVPTTAPAPQTQLQAAPAPATRPAAPITRAAAEHVSNSVTDNASVNAPLSLSPQIAQQPEPHTRTAMNAPVQVAPAAGGGYMVQVSSQRSEADAQASFRALQSKFPSVLGPRSPVIRRADLREKGVYYRAMVGPFGTGEEASQFCASLKSAGGQCVIQRN